MQQQKELFGLSDAKRKSIRRWVFLGMAGLMLGGIALGFVPFFVGSYRLQGVCESLTVGTTPNEARSRLEARGYEVVIVPDGRWLIEAPRLVSGVASPRGCELHFGPQGLTSARFGPSM